MYLRELTEGVISLTRAAENIINLHQNATDNEKNIELLYRMAENEQLRWLLTQFWQENRNEGAYIKTKATIRAEKYKRTLDIMDYWRKMRQLQDETARNIRSAGL